jgi:cyclopropane fatty-acyl-phospholipid synthase-like methyltransferase|tara:strand:- start:363 stop:1088 length:726 start_codon:yes stop_codon:yes gene_type:complete
MKNKEFFYQQYNKIKWENQEKTKINSFVNNFIIKEIVLKKKGNELKLFDIGFGIGFFFRQLYHSIGKDYKVVEFWGCEPSHKNYNYFKSKLFDLRKGVRLRTFSKPFLKVKTNEKFDFLTAIYVFPHFESDELVDTTKKINSMLKDNGKFILIVANEKYLQEKLRSKRDLFIENNIVNFSGKKYKEVLHYSEIPQIGTIIDYNREDQYYIDLFKDSGFNLEQKKELDDNGFICTIFVFEKK